jgi:formiminoglutamase
VDLARVPHLRPPPRIEEPLYNDPEFLRASEWLARAPAEPDALFLGVPFAGGSISRARCDLAPEAVRRALTRFSVWNSDRALSIEPLAVLDVGDVEPDDSVEKTQDRIAETVAAISEVEKPLVLVGGDNSITVGGARGMEADALLTFDAHHDCRDPSNGATNGSPVRQLVDDGMTAVAQIGIHGFANSEAHAHWAMEHKIHWIGASKVRDQGIGRTIQGALRFLGRARRVWVDFDLDVLDRAFAPGAPAAQPGGLSPVELQEAAYILGHESIVAGIDVVEVDPEQDVAETTVRTACAVILSYLAGVAAR